MKSDKFTHIKLRNLRCVQGIGGYWHAVDPEDPERTVEGYPIPRKGSEKSIPLVIVAVNEMANETLEWFRGNRWRIEDE